MLTEHDEIKTELVYFTDKKPPTRFGGPVKSLCTISWTGIDDFYGLEPFENDNGELARKIEYTIILRTDGSSLDFEVIRNGRRVASRNVSIDFSRSGYEAPESMEID